MTGILSVLIGQVFAGGSPPVTTDEYFEYTTLLLPGNGTNGAQNNTFLDGSTNNFTITRNGNTTQGTFSPFSQTGWGNYFSANTSELSFASNAAFNLSGVSWTIEFWTYPTENAPARDRNWITRRQASGGFTSSYQIYCGSGANTLKFLVTGQTVVTSTSSLTPNQWNHVAVVWNGTTLYFYINGVQDATTGTYGAGTGADAEPLRIGRLATNDNVLSYMSNVRVVKGVAVYTGNFTVPSTPLAITQSSGTNISAITGTQTSLLTCQTNRFVDVTANAFVPTVGTGTSVQAFSPFNPTASWSAATYGGSGYFDGSGDYLSAASNAAFSLGTGAFTIEGWVYASTTPSDAGFFTNGGAATGSLGFYFLTGYLRFDIYGGGGFAASTLLPLNQWVHIACVRSGNTVTLYQNGTSVGSSTITDNNTSSLCYVGTKGWDLTKVFNGYMGNLRLVKGTAVYTGAFTPPTSPLSTSGSASSSAYPSTTNVNTSFASSECSLLLNFTNAGIYDATSKNDLETVGDAKISTAITAKWGSGSIYFDGTGDYLTIPANAVFAFGTGDFTVEMFVNTSNLTTGGFISHGPAATSGYWAFELQTGSFYWQASGVANILVVSASSYLTSNTWTHLCVSRSSGTTRMFANGTQIGSATDNTNYSGATSGSLSIGRSYNSLNTTGYMQDVRITKGYARYVTGTGANAGKMVFNGTNDLALPTAAFPTL